MKRIPIPCHLSILIAPLLAALVLSGGCSKTFEETEPEGPLKVRVLSVTPTTLEPELVFTATVVTQNEARVHPEISGTVVEVPVRVGDTVSEGDLLCRLDPEKTELELQVATAERERAQSELDRKLSGYRPEEVASAKSVFENASAIFRSKQENLERNRVLHESGSMTDRDWTVFISEMAAADAMVQKASAEVTKMREGYESFDIRSASASLQLALAQENLARKNLRDTEIRSPLSGVVTRRDVEVGQLIGVANEVFEIKDPANIWMSADAGPKDARLLHVGQKAYLKTDYQEDWTPGYLDRIGEAYKDTTRSMPVWFAWNPGSRLPRVGEYGLAKVELDPVADALLLRRDWIYLSGGSHYVWLVEDGTLRQQPVVIGEDRGEDAILSGGLEPGMQVVVSPPSDFEEGLAVETQLTEVSPPTEPEDTLSLSMSPSANQ